MKRITIALDEEIARRARLEAARQRKSLSQYIGDILREQMRTAGVEYQKAYRRFLAMKPLSLVGPPERYPTREELYDRPVLRRDKDR